ncbi:MAG: oligosaccharide flippase family protein [Alphaproteobacteria bacterium]|nr:oligosaccharide flippase family protein [Alphaproteobacteria bacterium]
MPEGATSPEMSDSPDDSANSDRKRGVRALRSALAEKRVSMLFGTFVAQNVLRLASNLVLTRLLAPEAFGVVGVLMSINYVLQMLTDIGYSAFLIRSPEAHQPRFLNVVWTIRLLRSVVLTVFMLIFAGAFAAAFNKPELETPIRAVSFFFIGEALRSLQPIMAQRARRVSYISVIELACFIVQTAATIAAAFFIRSFWAIIIGMYVGVAAQIIFSYVAYPGGFHRIEFDRKIGGELWRFARVVAASSTITIFLNQADKIFIGRTLDLNQFGLYMLAANLTAAAYSLIRSYVNRILFPHYAEIWRTTPEQLNKIYYAARRKVTIPLAFLLGGGVGGGHLAVRILFDDRYLPAGVFVSWLCVPLLFALATYPAEQLMIVRGRIRSTLEANIVRFLWIVVAAPAGYHFFGIIGLVAAFAFMEAVPALYWWRRLAVAGVADLREEAYPFAAAALGAAIGFGLDRLVDYLIAAGTIPSF